MSSDRSGEVEPDAAALDELLRAFTADDPIESVRPARAASPAVDRTDDRDDASDDRDLGDDAGVGDLDDTHPDDDDLDDTGPDDGDVDLDDTGPDDGDLDDDPDDDAQLEATRGAVISIDDDELPDAVYVEGNLGGPSSGSDRSPVVFIEDDASGDTVILPASGAAGTGIEPRMRDRRNAVRRAAGRKRLRWVAAVGAVLVVAIAVLAVLGSPLFAVDRSQLTVTGAVYTDSERLGAVIDDLVGTPVLIADTRAAELELEAIPWVESARVRTQFPRSASIEIRERQPLATYQGSDGHFRVIDRFGRVLDVIDGQPIAYMPITGPDPVDLDAGAFTPPGYAAAAELVQALTATVRGQVQSVHVTSDGSLLSMFIDDVDADGEVRSGGIEVRFGAANDLLVKLVRLENILPVAIDEGARLIDVSTAEVTRQ